VTTNGTPANLLSGGEFPILVPQSLGTVTVQWKEYGVRLTAVPLLLGNGRVRLNLQPEVSQKDLSNSITTQGLTVPALTTRRVNTSVEMRFGETFMLGGLIEVQDIAQTNKVPWLGELPYFGALFRTVSYQSVETELVIMVTPTLAGAMTESQTPQGGPGMFSDQPTARELYGYGLLEVPSYGSHCTTCGKDGGYPPPIIDLDLSHVPTPLITPVPVQELPPSAPSPTTPAPAPPVAPAASSLAPLGAPAAIVTPPTTSWTPPAGDSTTSYSRSPAIRQVSAQSPAGGPNPVTQAGYAAPAANSTSGGGLYAPQSGLYVPASSGSP
jgi:pilus assembly protein CpaC